MTQRGERTRTRLIEATLAVVNEVGYARASTRAIAEAAGVAEGTIYRHFPDKASLFFAAALQPSAAVLAWFSDFPDRAGSASVEANLAEAMTQLSALQERVLPLELAIQADPELATQRRAALVDGPAVPGGPPDAIRAYLVAEQGLGRVRPDLDPDDASIVMLATLFGLAMTVQPPGSRIGSERIRRAVGVLVRGILAA